LNKGRFVYNIEWWRIIPVLIFIFHRPSDLMGGLVQNVMAFKKWPETFFKEHSELQN